MFQQPVKMKKKKEKNYEQQYVFQKQRFILLTDNI